ncbi:MAG TPA: PHP domain-containing protein [Nitrolancea sp.]|nr:PHP domain-containing protein [Nitrolancea sp.]
MPQARAEIAPLDRVDVHLHTLSSDGGWTPTQLVDYLVEHDFRVAAVCDHDTMRSVPEFLEYGAEKGLVALPGVEFTTFWDERQWHLLVYGIDPNALNGSGFGALLARQQANLRAAAERAISLLEQHGHKLPSLNEQIDGRPLLPVHVLRTVIKDGHATNLTTAHQLVIKYGEDLRVDTPLESVVDAAHQLGGICVIAHPGRDDGDGLMSAERLAKMLETIPIDGLECHYRSYTLADIERYRGMALDHSLLISSGSDSHAPGVPVYPRPYQARWVARFLARQGITVAPIEGEAWTPEEALPVIEPPKKEPAEAKPAK